MRQLLRKIEIALRALQNRTGNQSAPETVRLAETQAAQLRALAAMVASTEAEEAGCDEVYELVDQYAEMILRGESAATWLPRVEQHLNRCLPCREEYEALMAILRMEQSQIT